MKRKQPCKKQTARKSTGGSVRVTSLLTHYETDLSEENSNGHHMMTDDDSSQRLKLCRNIDNDMISECHDNHGSQMNNSPKNQNYNKNLNEKKNDTSNGSVHITSSQSSLSPFVVYIDSDEIYHTPPETIDENNSNSQIQNLQEDIQILNESIESVSSGETGWVSNKTVHAYKFKFKTNRTGKSKIAAFDLDGTLITPKSKSKFSKDVNDWKILDGRLKAKINKLVQDGFEFVIFSNQMGVSLKFITLEEIKLKFMNILESFDIPCVAIFCTYLNKYRKPAVGMFEYYKSINQAQIDLENSFFVGDAMGRIKDHSAADLLFAFNCKLPFIPIESFLSGFEKPKRYEYEQLKKYRIPKFSPNTSERINQSRIIAKGSKNSSDGEFLFIEELVNAIEKFINDNCKSTVILLIGLFGSGKTFFFNKYLAELHYECIGYDPSRSWQEEKEIFNSFVQNDDVLNKRIIIDQPNLNEQQRKRWIELAKREGYEVFAIYLKVPVDQCAHLIRFRNFYMEPNRRMPSENELLKQSLAFREPRYDEGFKTIYLLDFFENFSDLSLSNLRQYYHHYLHDKP